VLKSDHAEVTKLFRQFERLCKSDDREGMQQVAQAVCKALGIHAEIEESIFYPALRNAADADAPLDEADVEHSHIKELVAQLESAQPGDELFEARMTVLSEYVQHHVKEEESTLFAKARKAGCDLVALGEQLLARKAELGGGEAVDIAALTARSTSAKSRHGQRASR
jgi:iron-sulfur cluster repair protein YtfE (RIC family)